jgi:hypothetical protein
MGWRGAIVRACKLTNLAVRPEALSSLYRVRLPLRLNAKRGSCAWIAIL